MPSRPLLIVLCIAVIRSASAQDSVTIVHPDSTLPGVANSKYNCVAVSPWARAHGLPQFEGYKVSDTDAVLRHAPVRLDNHIARLYRTVIRQGATARPDFAGHFTVVAWPNGTAPNFVIVDALTGEVGYDTLTTFWLHVLPMYRRDSRLMIFDETYFGHDSVRYLEWTGKRFRYWERSIRRARCVDRDP